MRKTNGTVCTYVTIAAALMCCSPVFAARASHHNPRTSKGKDKLISFSLRLGHWPKCAGQAISNDDFNIITDPANVTTVTSWPDSTVNEGATSTTHIAYAKLNGVTKQCIYTILSKNGNVCQDVQPDNFTTPLNDAYVYYLDYQSADHVYSYYVEERLTGTSTGKGVLSQVNSSGWTGCGSGISLTKKDGYGVELNVGAEWAGGEGEGATPLKGSVGYSFDESTSVKFESPAVDAKSQIIYGYKQTMTITTKSVARYRRMKSIGLGITMTGDSQFNVQENYTDVGEGTPKLQLCLQCCGI